MRRLTPTPIRPSAKRAREAGSTTETPALGELKVPETETAAPGGEPVRSPVWVNDHVSSAEKTAPALAQLEPRVKVPMMSQTTAAKGCGLLFSKIAALATNVPRPGSPQLKLAGSRKFAAVGASNSVGGSGTSAISPKAAVGVMVLGARLKRVVVRTSPVVDVDAPYANEPKM